VILALLLAQAVAGPVLSESRASTNIFIRWEARTKACLPEINGVEVGDIATDAGKHALDAALPDKGAEVHLRAGDDAPYDCFIGIIDALKRQGFHGRIGFISEPPRP
jgi:hypothetical protein